MSLAAQLQKQGIAVAGLQLIEVDTSKVRPNPFNPNRQVSEIFEREKRSILRHGFIDPITVREAADGAFEIVDGEHRWRAARELTSTGAAALGRLPAVNLGKISDDDAKRLVILFNELRGEPDPAKLALVLKDLVANVTVDDLSLDLPMTPKDIESMVKAVDFDWNTLEGGEFKPKETATAKAFSDTTTFAMGSVKAHIPMTLASTFLAEFEQSAQVVGTKNPEIVLRHFISRLQKVPAADVAPEVLPEKREPTKIGKKKAAKAAKEVQS
jgi:ParB/RepB/Spo0J family partition protein